MHRRHLKEQTKGMSQMDNFYKQSMLFLTYIQGPTMTKWTKAMGDWLKQSTIVRRRDKFDPLLREQTELAFN